MNRSIKILLFAGVLLFSKSVIAEKISDPVKNIHKERALIENQAKDLEIEYKIRKEYLDKAFKSLESREEAFRGSCPNPPCELIP